LVIFVEFNQFNPAHGLGWKYSYTGQTGRIPEIQNQDSTHYLTPLNGVCSKHFSNFPMNGRRANFFIGKSPWRVS